MSRASPRNCDNPERGRAFQVLAANLLSQHWGVDLECEVSLPIGRPPKYHRFDLASKDRKYVGETKNYTWTRSGNMPSAKMAFVNEAVFYLSHLPGQSTRFVVMPRHVRPKTGQSLADCYFKTYRHLLSGVRVLEVNVKNGTVREVSETTESEQERLRLG